MQSYDYSQRSGVLEISWDDFGKLAVKLVEALACFRPQVVVGIARAGLFPATAAACMLRCEYYPVRVTRRMNDEVLYKTPQWKTPLSPEVAGRTVAVVDEIADTGETLAMVADEARARGAERVVTACLVSHSWAQPAPQICVLVSDALVIFPWDRQVFQNGRWGQNPEIKAALKAQG